MLKLHFGLETLTLLRAEVGVETPDGDIVTIAVQYDRIDMGRMLQKVLARGYKIHGQAFLTFGKNDKMLLEVVLIRPDSDGIPF